MSALDLHKKYQKKGNDSHSQNLDGLGQQQKCFMKKDSCTYILKNKYSILRL